MAFTSLGFLGFAVLAVALLRLAPTGWARDLSIAGLNAAFVLSFAARPADVVPLVLFVILGYGAIWIACLARFRFTLAFLIVGLMALFLWLKQYTILSFLPAPGFSYLNVGLSYILFRIMHLVIDVAQGEKRPPSVLSYLNYVFFFLSFVSGPIQRHEEFAAEAAAKPGPIAWETVNTAAGRIVLGYFMVVVVSGPLAQAVAALKPELLHSLEAGFSGTAVELYAVAAAVYFVDLFMNFAGYMHIVIGISLLAGFRLPENFERPYEAGNFMEFWSRWHITLSNWFKFYLFNPLLKVFVAAWGTRQRGPYLGAAAFFVTFLAMGMWHGTTYVFFVYGALLGLGISLSRLWQLFMGARLGAARYKALRARRWYDQLARGLTLGYFTVALTCLWITQDELWTFLSPAGLAVTGAGFAVLIVLGAVLSVVWDGAKAMLSSLVAAPTGAAKPTFKDVVLAPLCVFAAAAVLEIVLLTASHAAAASSTVRLASIVLIFGSVAGCGGIVIGLFDRSASSFFSLWCRGARWRDAMAAWLGVRILVLASFWVLLGSAVPQFIYKAF